jgi:hypothetical protein
MRIVHIYHNITNLCVIKHFQSTQCASNLSILLQFITFPKMSIKTSLSAKELTRRISIFQKFAVGYTVGLKHLESCRDYFRNLKILTIYTLHIQET